MNKDKITHYVINETPQQFYNIKNDECPICESKFNYIVPVFKFGNIGYCLKCCQHLEE